MSKKTTVRDMAVFSTRKDRFSQKLRQLENMFYGLDRPLSALTQSEERYSAEKAESAAAALSDCWIRTAAFIKRRNVPEQSDALDAFPPGLISDAERRFSRDFLFCLLHMAGSPFDEDANAEATLAGLVQLAGRLDYRYKSELLRDERTLDDYDFECSSLSGFFRCGDAIYTGLSGRRLTLAVEEEDVEPEEAFQPDPDLPDDETLDYEMTPEEEADLRAAQEDFEEWYGRMAELRQEWLDAFPARDAFCQAWLRCRDAWFETGLLPQTAGEITAWAVDLFLMEQGASCGADDVFFFAYGLLEETIERLAGLLRGE